jgi:hypothetical protein
MPPGGQRRIVWGRSASGRYHGEEFFNDECGPDQQDKFEAVMMVVAQTGFSRNTKIFRYPLKGRPNIGEFKTHQKRLFFYRDGNDLIITHGATKKKDETDPNELTRVETLQAEIKLQEAEALKRPPRGGR